MSGLLLVPKPVGLVFCYEADNIDDDTSIKLVVMHERSLHCWYYNVVLVLVIITNGNFRLYEGYEAHNA